MYLYDERDVWRIWRYTNLAHVTAMIGLSPAYTKQNLFDQFVEEGHLFEPEDKPERALLERTKIGDTGMRASQACISWAMSVVAEARRLKMIEKPEGVTLGDKLLLLRTSLAVMARDDVSVTIDQAALESFADDYSADRVQSMRKEVEWDACDWHYTPKDLPGDSTAQYIFVMDSLNYCFWPVEGLEYEQLATSLRDVLKADPSAFDAAALKSMTSAQLQVSVLSSPIPALLSFSPHCPCPFPLFLFAHFGPPSLRPSLRPRTIPQRTTTPGLVPHTHTPGDRRSRAPPTGARLGLREGLRWPCE